MVWAKIRTIMRDKILYLTHGQQPKDEDYLPLLNLPNTLEPLDMSKYELFEFTRHLTSKQVDLFQNIKAEARKAIQRHVHPTSGTRGADQEDSSNEDVQEESDDSNSDDEQ